MAINYPGGGGGGLLIIIRLGLVNIYRSGADSI